jgi:glutathione S-transferase
MILHHYELSPFSEKVRLMFGYTGLPWQSLISPEMPPRPSLDPLVGGYRRIPVGQIGADLFCDTRLICEEMAQLAAMPNLALDGAGDDLAAFVANLDSAVFWDCVLSIPVGTTLKQLVRKVGLWRTLRFVKDRAAVGKNARMTAPQPKQAAQQFGRHLEGLEQRLQSSFLFGDSPGIADFSAYHTLWFQCEVAELPMPADLPRVMAWYRRMSEFGHGERQEISQAQAFSAARDNTPRPISVEYGGDSSIGERVSVRPSDYALDAVEGELVGASDTRLIVARETDAFGTVHVHFPRIGYELAHAHQ